MPKQKLPATSFQLATLHSLLLKTTELAKQINYPINGFFLDLLRPLLGEIINALPAEAPLSK